jgi:hypothetical protein
MSKLKYYEKERMKNNGKSVRNMVEKSNICLIGRLTYVKLYRN